ncbi:MAG: PSD1 and planctomycete cytochrome C domain-containing protein [Planctomycetota bacterium]|nr:PSD1 and planctomycete cytochrome C domain-containing protein [Planctomycetota bacterium]
MQRLAPIQFFLCWLALGIPVRAQDDKAGEQFFEQEVLPILRDNCFDCHSHESGESGGKLMLDSLAAMQVGGTRGSSITGATPEKSLLWRAVEYEESTLQMPPDGKLPQHQIDGIQKWLKMGTPVPAAWKGNMEAFKTGGEAAELAKSHWAYQPVRRFEQGTASIDTLLETRRRTAGLEASARADRRTLLFRAHYDLTGLRPSCQELREFEADERDDQAAFAVLVDRLLSSPHFGERWARHWMDIARYADNKGYVFQEDREYKEAYKYRDWLIESFNRDMPYDEFVKHQLAADLLPDNESNVRALGFVTLGRRFLNNQFDIIDDRLDVVSRGLMGMTLACARCHDHKYDPISQKDYYSMAGVFFNVDEPKEGGWPHRLSDRKTMRPAHVLLRGSPRSIGEKVPRRFVRFLSADSPDFPADRSGRLELAEHITGSDNPLTARVLANRIWMHLTGSSLVQTPSDLGLRCPPPQQAELLDYLATQLVAEGWSIKSLIREIMLSESYAQQSIAFETAMKIDPENQLYSRMNRRRVDFETLRDSLLASTGQLDLYLFGASEKIEAQSGSRRRSVYAYIDRQNLPPVFRTFDLASPDAHSPGRSQTTVPQQGLFMLNSSFVQALADELAGQALQKSAGKGEGPVVDWLVQQILVRRPDDSERRWISKFLDDPSRQSKNATKEAHARWSQLVQILLSSNEFSFVD